MLGRLQIVLLTTLPTGAALLYLLWIYHHKRASQRRIEGKRPGETSCTQVTSAVNNGECGKHTREKPNAASETSLCGDWRNVVDGDALSVASSKSVSSLLHGELTAAVECSEEQLQVVNKLGGHLPPATMPCESKNGIAVGSAHSDVDAASISVGDSSERTENSLEMLTVSEQLSSANSSVCKGDDICVRTLPAPVHVDGLTANCGGVVMTNGLSTGDSEEDNSWGVCVPDDALDDEVMCSEHVPLIMESCGNIRKDSLDSTSDANSCDSRDRNANEKHTTAILTKSQHRRGSTSKEKTLISHAFDFPTELCGRLIGQRGRNIAMIKEKSGAEIFIKAKMYDVDWQVVKLEGSRQQVNKALDLIRRRFPMKRFTLIDYNRCTPDAPVVPAELMRLILPYGVPVEVIVSHVISPNHVFVQQPTHPTFPLLERQTYNMRACYSLDNVPMLPQPIEVGMICAAPLSGDWFRAQVVQSVADADEYDLKLIDYGGYVRLPGTCLRQIRSDFMTVPFQAIECYLANVIPPTDDEDFPVNAKNAMEEMVKGCILQCDVIGVEMDGVQYVVLTKVNGSERKVISCELVNSGVARWLEM